MVLDQVVEALVEGRGVVAAEALVQEQRASRRLDEEVAEGAQVLLREREREDDEVRGLLGGRAPRP